MCEKNVTIVTLCRVFSFLDIVSLCRCAQVSKYWNILALDGSNWQYVDLFSFQRDVEVTSLKYTTTVTSPSYHYHILHFSLSGHCG